MNSFNHYSYGAIGDWMYRKMVGLDTYEDGVGYKHIKIQPHIGGGFSFASANIQTYYGKLSSGWKVGVDTITIDVEIPANTTATIFIPAAKADEVTESGKALSAVSDIKVTGTEGDYVILNVGYSRRWRRNSSRRIRSATRRSSNPPRSETNSASPASGSRTTD